MKRASLCLTKNHCVLVKIVILKNVNNKVVTEDTLVLYFPGSFGCFHKGHMDIVHRAVADAKNITDDYVLVFHQQIATTPLTSMVIVTLLPINFDTNVSWNRLKTVGITLLLI